MSLQTVHIIVKGKVQGVFFRADARDLAQKLNITGWASNKNEDSVEILAQGQPAELTEFLQWCHKGSTAANVEEVTIEYRAQQQELTGFNIQ